jgi:uncharacterized membrane protein (UPF0127 family)
MRGLMGRRSLPAGEGLLLKPAPSIHTAFMRFSIDVIFLDRDLQVVRLVDGLPPWRAASARAARTVLELAAGEIARREIQVGDKLEVIDERLRTASLGELPAAETATLDRDRAKGLNGAGASTRVLLISTDRRFRAVAGALFSARGCSVTLGERITNVLELCQREGAEVVILDAGASPSAATSEAARIRRIEPRVGVVIVGEEPLEGAGDVAVLPKWGSFEDLYATVMVRAEQNPRSQQ